MHTVAMVGPGHEASAQIARGSGAVRLKAIFLKFWFLVRQNLTQTEGW